MNRSAILSECTRYRYTLARIWDAGPCLGFVMLNPSTADATLDDPTIRRCIGFARKWGYGSLVVGNLFAYRATEPDDLKAVDDPIGPANNEHLARIAQGCDRIVCAWGSHRMARGLRAQFVVDHLRDYGANLCALKISKDGSPGHPLYISGDTLPVKFEGRA